MLRIVLIGSFAILSFVLASCNQPFEPDGPVNNKLVVYSILNANSNTRYVRVSTTYQAPPGLEIHDATVQMFSNGRTIGFRDTTIQVTDSNGTVSPLNLYVASDKPLTPGATYFLQVSTPSGLSASANATALLAPSFALSNPLLLDSASGGQFAVNTLFRSLSGAYVMHFYVDYYAYVDGGWELHRSEIPATSTFEANGNLVETYPTLALVKSFAVLQKSSTIQFDNLVYARVLGRIVKQYPAAPVIWLQAVFVLTQIDDVLYSYYYIYNGPVDKSSIRLDQPDYTNFPNGLGVFGSSITVTNSYPIKL